MIRSIYGMPSLIKPRIDLEEFILFVKNKTHHISYGSKKCFDYILNNDKSYITHGFHDNDDIYFFYTESIIGGYFGGSCWGGTAEPFSSPENYQNDKKSFDNEFQSIILELFPTITLTRYKIIYDNCIKEKECSENEYYGNSSDKIVIYFIIENLFNELKSCNLI